MTLQHIDTTIGFVVVMLLVSMLITVLVQIVIAVLGLRGRNLLWGVKTLLKQLGIDKHAQEVAAAVLSHKAISHTGGRKATAIHVDELIRLLHDLVAHPDPKKINKEAQAELEAAMQSVKTVSPALTGAAKDVVAELEKLFPQQTQAIQDAVGRAVNATRTGVHQIASWFDMIMARTTERFVLHTRWITAFFAVVLAFGLHIDSLRLVQRLWTDGELRARLVQSSDAVLQKAEGTLAQTAERKALASAAIVTVARDMENNPDAKILATAPKNLMTREEGHSWLGNALQKSKSQDEFLSRYDDRFEEATKAWLNDLRTSVDSVRGQINGLGLGLVPTPWPAWQTYTSKRHLLGLLISSLLLSLGAPFWFNALRQLANLRPTLAGKVEAQS